jgi:hypothetical protein
MLFHKLPFFVIQNHPFHSIQWNDTFDNALLGGLSIWFDKGQAAFYHKLSLQHLQPDDM